VGQKKLNFVDQYNQKSNFMKILPAAAEMIHVDGQTDG
jgi:hypothetical protein